MDKAREFHCLKKRRKTETNSNFGKVDSPLAKYDSSGNLTCILCRIPVKSNIWKVHINSKQHKKCVELAKRQSVETGSISLISNKPNSGQVPVNSPISSEDIAPPDAVKSRLIPVNNDSVSHQAKVNTANTLPEKFFDQEKSLNSIESGRDLDGEWAKFQREIREAATISNTIVAEEQDSLNIKRHLKELDEQIDNWKRFIKLNDKKNILSKKQRLRKKEIALNIDSSSSEECSVDDCLDWRIKSVHK